MINKIVRKSMLKKKGLLIAISILIIISTVFIGMSHFVYDTMANNYEQLQAEANIEDFRLYTLPVSSENHDKVYTSDLIARLERKFDISLERVDSTIYKTDDDTQLSYGISKYIEDDQIDQIILQDGQLPTKQGQVLLLPQALTELGLQVGDEITIAEKKYTISGSGYMANWIMPSDFTNNQMFPDLTKFNPIVMNANSYDKLDKDSKDFTFSIAYKGKFFNSKMKQQKRLRKYEQIEDASAINIPVLDDMGKPQITKTGQIVTKQINLFPFALDRSYNPNISSIENEIKGSRTAFTFLAGLLSIITVFLATILVNSVFKSQRREMGIMKAEGVSISKLGFGFAVFILIIILISGAIGGYISTYTSVAMRDLYSNMFMLKEYQISDGIISQVVIQILTTSLIMIIAIYYFSIRRNLNTPTLHLIKNISSEKTPKYNIGKYFRRLSFVRKYQLNLLLRNISKTILLTFAVFVSSFLLLLGALMYTSMHNMMGNMYKENFTFEYVVLFNDNSFASESDYPNGMISTSARLKSVSNEQLLDEPLTGEEVVNIEAYDFDKTQTVHLTDTDGNKISNDLDGVIASTGFMKNYNLEIGDQIIVENPFDVTSEVKLNIVAETNDFFLPYVYMPIDTFRREFSVRDDMINGYQSTVPLTNDVKKEIKEKDPSAFIYESTDAEEMMGDALQTLNVAILIIATLAAIIAFIAMYSISTVIIESNSKTISVMKVLGYTSAEVRTMTIGVYKWLVIFIYLISIPLLEQIIQSTVDYAMRDMDFNIPINLNYRLSLLGIIVIYLVYILSSQITYRKIDKIKLSESIKADE